MPGLLLRRKGSSLSSGSVRNDPQLIVRRFGHYGSNRSSENLNKSERNGDNSAYSTTANADSDISSSNRNSLVSKWKNWQLRLALGLVMILGISILISLGHLAIIIMTIAIQTSVYREVINVAHAGYRERRLPWFRTLNWYFLLCAYYYLFGESLIQFFKDTVFSDAFLLPLATHHRFISFCLYLFGLILFVLNLKKGHYKFQFNQFGLTHMTVLLVIVQAQYVILNIFEGLFWFSLPVALVVVNDIMAYAFGLAFGRTPLIKLSPKKTWEGFIGAFLATVLFGFLFSGFLAKFKYLTCPITDLSTSIFSNFDCKANPLFELHAYRLPKVLAGFLRLVLRVRVKELYFYPVQMHSLVFSIFASVIAPFGGFFASGFKRAFKIKDFSDSIPGHGGMTDRMDCQFLMGFFVYMYFASFLKYQPMTVGTILEMAVNKLTTDDQRILYLKLQEYLVGQELLTEPGPIY